MCHPAPESPDSEQQATFWFPSDMWWGRRSLARSEPVVSILGQPGTWDSGAGGSGWTAELQCPLPVTFGLWGSHWKTVFSELPLQWFLIVVSFWKFSTTPWVPHWRGPVYLCFWSLELLPRAGQVCGISMHSHTGLPVSVRGGSPTLRTAGALDGAGVSVAHRTWWWGRSLPCNSTSRTAGKAVLFQFIDQPFILYLSALCFNYSGNRRFKAN